MSGNGKDPLFVIQADMIIGIVSDPNVFEYLGTTNVPEIGDIDPDSDWGHLNVAFAQRASEVMQAVSNMQAASDIIQLRQPELHLLGQSDERPKVLTGSSAADGGSLGESVDPTDSTDFPAFGPPEKPAMTIEHEEGMEEPEVVVDGLNDPPNSDSSAVLLPGRGEEGTDARLNLELDKPEDDESGLIEDTRYHVPPFGFPIEILVGVAAGKYGDESDDFESEHVEPEDVDDFGTIANPLVVWGAVAAVSAVVSAVAAVYSAYTAANARQPTEVRVDDDGDVTVKADPNTEITVAKGSDGSTTVKIGPKKEKPDPSPPDPPPDPSPPDPPPDPSPPDPPPDPSPPDPPPDPSPPDPPPDPPEDPPGDTDVAPGDPTQEKYFRLQSHYRDLFGQIGDFVRQEWFMDILDYLNQLPNAERLRFVEQQILPLSFSTILPNGISISRTVFTDFTPLFCISAESKTMDGHIVAATWFDVAPEQGLDRLRGGNSMNIPLGSTTRYRDRRIDAEMFDKR